MIEFEQLDEDGQNEYIAKIEDCLQPLVDAGIAKKVKARGKNLYQTPINPVKLMAYIQKAVGDKGDNYNSIVIKGTQVLLTFGIFNSMIYLINEHESEKEEKFNRLFEAMRND